PGKCCRQTLQPEFKGEINDALPRKRPAAGLRVLYCVPSKQNGAGSSPAGRAIYHLCLRPLSVSGRSLNQALAAICKTTSSSSFGPFGPTRGSGEGSSKQRPAFSATSLRNSTSCLILSYRPDMPSSAHRSQ